MAKMIPNYIDQENSKLDGERMVFNWLLGNEIAGVAMHSLLQKNHKRKMIAEVDFLLISKKGILCIEVKGGQEIYRKEGEWYSASKKQVQNNDPNHNKIKDPFRQVKDCAYALKSYLIDTYGRSSVEANYLVGYAVVFPECKFTGTGNDLVTEVMFDCRWNLDKFPKFIDNTFIYWLMQEKEKHSVNCDILTVQRINRLVDLFRGDFCVVPSMSLEFQHIEKQMLELTDEQYDILDITSENKRVIIQGVAGTGKSILAVEKARQTIAKKQKVLYLCFNRNMAQYAKNSLSDSDSEGSYVGTYHSLLQKALNRNDLYNSDIETVSDLFAKGSHSIDEYDYLIVDEAQDLMYACVWETLSFFLKNGMEKGRWIVFIDPNQNLFNQSDSYDFAWEYLKESYSPFNFSLTRNCRNTEQIGRRTSVMTLVPPAKHMKLSGPKVMAKSYQSDDEMISMLKKDLSSLFSGGVVPSEIVILSKNKLCNSAIFKKASLCNLDVIEISNISEINKRALNYFTIQSYKGLESKIVMLIDVDGFKSNQNRALNYVAMSRAKILLYVFYKESVKEEYFDIVEQGEQLLI